MFPDSLPASKAAAEGGFVQDLIFVVVTIFFFLLSLGYVGFCDRIR
jgi:hypothetical protein